MHERAWPPLRRSIEDAVDPRPYCRAHAREGWLDQRNSSQIERELVGVDGAANAESTGTLPLPTGTLEAMSAPYAKYQARRLLGGARERSSDG
jgi:hypothetical protein